MTLAIRKLKYMCTDLVLIWKSKKVLGWAYQTPMSYDEINFERNGSLCGEVRQRTRVDGLAVPCHPTRTSDRARCHRVWCLCAPSALGPLLYGVVPYLLHSLH